VAATSNERRILVTTSAAHFLAHLYELSFPAMALTLQDEIGWSLGEVLRLSFTMYLLFGVGSLPMGLLTDWWKARWMLVLCMLGSGIGACLVALSHGKAQFVASLALVGLCASMYHPAGMALLSRSMRERGRALGTNGVFGNLGSASAPFLAGLLAYSFGWRAAYAVLGGLGILAGLLALAWPFTETDPRRAPAQAMPGGGGRTTLGYFLILCVAMTLAGFTYRGVSLVLPAAFRAEATFFSDWLRGFELGRIAGISNLAAATLASVTYAAGMLGQLVGGRLADQHDLRKMYFLFHAASLPFLIAMAFAAELPLLLFACGFVFFSLGMQPIENSLVARFTPERWRSTSYGVKFVLNFGVGATAVYAVTAVQTDGGFRPAFLLLAGAVALVCLAIAALLVRSRGVHVSNAPVVQPIA